MLIRVIFYMARIQLLLLGLVSLGKTYASCSHDCTIGSPTSCNDCTICCENASYYCDPDAESDLDSYDSASYGYCSTQFDSSNCYSGEYKRKRSVEGNWFRMGELWLRELSDQEIIGIVGWNLTWPGLLNGIEISTSKNERRQGGYAGCVNDCNAVFQFNLPGAFGTITTIVRLACHAACAYRYGMGPSTG